MPSDNTGPAGAPAPRRLDGKKLAMVLGLALLLAAAAGLVLHLALRERDTAPPAAPGAAPAASSAPASAASPSPETAAPEASAAAPSAPAADSEPPRLLRVGSYNIQAFGETKASRRNVLETLAKIAAGFDLLAVQEVGSNASRASDETCVAVLEAWLGAIDSVDGAEDGLAYAYARAYQYALLYRPLRLELLEALAYEGAERFSYRPLVARFRAREGGLDFLVLTVHTSPPKAKEEIPALARAMAELSTRYAEPDVVCLGDYNADGAYYAEGGAAWLAGFPPEAFVTVVPNEADTTVGPSGLAYDRIQLSAAMGGDWAGSWGVIRPGQLYDLTLLEGTATTAGGELALSDHYPVWADFFVHLDAD